MTYSEHGGLGQCALQAPALSLLSNPQGRTLLLWARRTGPSRLKGVHTSNSDLLRVHCQDCPSLESHSKPMTPFHRWKNWHSKEFVHEQL